LLALVVLAVWIRSYVRTDIVAIYLGADRHIMLVSKVGLLDIGNANWSSGSQPPLWRHYASRIVEVDPSLSVLTPESSPRYRGTPYSRVPYWAFFLILSAYPGWLVWKSRFRGGMAKVGYCASCGYDLRGSIERCPECGKVAFETIKESAGNTAP
jgi:hypothetical protein